MGNLQTEFEIHYETGRVPDGARPELAQEEG
jgi:hypothetical protein